jgi:hypothetical protein
LGIESNWTLTYTLRGKQVEIGFTGTTDILVEAYFAIGNAGRTLIILE